MTSVTFFASPVSVVASGISVIPLLQDVDFVYQAVDEVCRF